MLTRPTLFLLAALSASVVQAAGEIFPDPGLETAIKAVLKKQGKESIQADDLKNI
ncbi:MAG: hypothetical protein VB858_22865 [Planctomycetaceae bacterium]